MADRIWGLSRRQTVIALCSAAAIGIVVALLLGGNDGSSTAPDDRGIVAIDAGRAGSPHAVWAFGFQTLRFRADLRGAQQLRRVQGFGSVLGVSGRVYLYDAASGRVGVLRSASNRLVDLGTVPPGTAQDDLFAPTLARSRGGLWLVSAPGAVARFDLAGRRVGATVDVASDGHVATTTAVVAAGGALFTATRDDAGVSIVKVDPATGAVGDTARLDVPAQASLDGFAGDADHVWVVAAGNAYDLDPRTLQPSRTVAIDAAQPTAVRGAVASAGALWVLVHNGGALARVDAANGRVAVVLRVLERRPGAFRIPASLIGDGARVYAMVQQGSDRDDHRVRIVGYDMSRRRATPGVDLPSRFFAGALASS